MDKQFYKREFIRRKDKIYDEFKKDCERINRLTEPKVIIKEIEKCKWEYNKKWINLENFYSRHKLQGIVSELGTITFNRYRNDEFIKIKKKHNLISKEEEKTYQNLNENKGENNHHQTFSKEVLKQNNKESTYTCAECLQDKTGVNWSCKEKSDGNKLCSKKCFQKYYGEICNNCVKECLNFYRDKDYSNIVYCSDCWKKKQLENPDQEWNPIIYCRYCATKTDLFEVCEQKECLEKMNKDIEHKKSKNNNPERERERATTSSTTSPPTTSNPLLSLITNY